MDATLLCTSLRSATISVVYCVKSLQNQSINQFQNLSFCEFFFKPGCWIMPHSNIKANSVPLLFWRIPLIATGGYGREISP